MDKRFLFFTGLVAMLVASNAPLHASFVPFSSIMRDKDYAGSGITDIEMGGRNLNPNAWINVPDDQGQRPLHRAVNEGDEKRVAWLIKHGVDVDGRNFEGETALHRVINCFDKNKVVVGAAIIQMLLTAHINANLQDNNGNTALHCAVSRWQTSRENEDIVEMLLKAGAEPNLQNNNSEYPLYLAYKHSNYSVAKLLKEYGAQEHFWLDSCLVMKKIADERAREEERKSRVYWSGNISWARGISQEERDARFEIDRIIMTQLP